jgi:hypothetical protein
MQPIAIPRGQRRCQARGRIMEPRRHEHLPGNRISQLMREGAFSCECVVGVSLCGPPRAQGVTYHLGIS